MTDYSRLVKEWQAVKSYWNRDDNISLSKHCEEAEVDYKRCITHNQPMRKLGTREERNKYADEQIARLQSKSLPPSQRQPATRPRSESPPATPHEHPITHVLQQAEIERLKDQIRVLQEQKDALADKLQEALQSNQVQEATKPDPWENHFKDVFERKTKEINEWKDKYNQLFTIIQAGTNEIPDGWTEAEEVALEADWFENYKALRRRRKFKIALPKADEEELKFD